MPGITDPTEEYFKDGLWGWVTDQWKKLVANDDGYLQVDVVTSGIQSTVPAIANVTMTSAATEYSQALPATCRKFLIRCRGLYDIQLAFTAAGSGATYLTIPAGMTYNEDLIQAVSLTLYFQCATAAQVAEIVAWS